ncbi:MAG: hypothetical protein QNJ73_07745 [Gammaproteobacteria bacterium]|nr:hypothetical protein [Gammaproteobacteria bacterium]
MDLIAQAFQVRWFFGVSLFLALLYGLGGTVHIANILGFGELPWLESPLSWRIGDVWWGSLDILALVGVALKWPVGLAALALAAVTQAVFYTFWPEWFALSAEHYSALRSLIYFNTVVLLVLGVSLILVHRGYGT